MKTLGLLGGMSWESTVPYYRLINQGVNQRLGGLHSARLLLYSVDFHDIEILQRQDAWNRAGALLAEAAQRLEAAGAEGLALCTNTMHKVIDAIEAAVTLPVLHVADATAQTIRQQRLQTVGLLGTRFTMEQDFYIDRLRQHGLTVRVPPESDRAFVHRVIYEELCRGQCLPTSRQVYRRIIADLAAAGAEGVILGCTEIGLLLQAEDSPVPLFDTTALHAAAAVTFMLEESL